MLGQEQVVRLLYKLCTELGFCLPPAQQRRLANQPPQDILEFTNAVFVAEGLNPEMADRHLYRRVRDVVTQAFQEAEAQQCVQAATRETRAP